MELHHNQAIETIYANVIRQSLRQIAVCSLREHAGNTTLAYTLAKRAASSGRKVLLIELNIARPKLHTLERKNSKEWLPIENGWEQGLQQSIIPNLTLLTTPRESGHCVEFHDLDTLKLFFKTASSLYDLIVCDSAPLLCNDSGQIAGDLVSSACEHCILNVLTNMNTECQLEEAKQLFYHNKANLVGVVMNDQYAPSLKDELVRESHKLNRLLPRLMTRVRLKLQHAVILNQDL